VLSFLIQVSVSSEQVMDLIEEIEKGGSLPANYEELVSDK
jgi:hypothetical protein